jgi:hypothetical protein
MTESVCLIDIIKLSIDLGNSWFYRLEEINADTGSMKDSLIVTYIFILKKWVLSLFFLSLMIVYVHTAIEIKITIT